MNYPDLPPGYYWCATARFGRGRVEIRKRILWFFYEVIYTSYNSIALQYPKYEQEDINLQVKSLWNLHEQQTRNKTRKS